MTYLKISVLGPGNSKPQSTQFIRNKLRPSLSFLSFLSRLPTHISGMETKVSKGIILLTISFLLGLILCHYLVSQFITNGLNRYPGPWLAKFSKLWLRWDVQTNRHQRHLLELHRTHGDVVRVGPNNLSIANPDYVTLIYGVKREFLKVRVSLGAST